MRVQDMIMAAGMLIAGTVNTISSKLQDEIHVVGLPGSTERPFEHPAVQTLAMFMGESLCMFAFIISERQRRKRLALGTASEGDLAQDKNSQNKAFPVWTFGLPAMCDMTGSTLMYIGLLLTYPSVYQMLRGMIVVFTGIFSFFFLGRKLKIYHGIGMLLIIIGTFLVGLSSVLHQKGAKAPNPLLGNILVVSAQLVAATQMVLEEKFIGRYNVNPLEVVGNEGLWGGAVTTIVLFVVYWITPIRHADNSLDAAYQVYNSPALLGALLLSVISIAFLNFFGISVTKYLSATHRTTIDASRVVLVWLVSLLLKWEDFDWLQLGGFIILLIGTAIFNEIIRFPFFKYDKAPAAVTDNESINENKKLLDE